MNFCTKTQKLKFELNILSIFDFIKIITLIYVIIFVPILVLVFMDFSVSNFKPDEFASTPLMGLCVAISVVIYYSIVLLVVPIIIAFPIYTFSVGFNKTTKKYMCIGGFAVIYSVLLFTKILNFYNSNIIHVAMINFIYFSCSFFITGLLTRSVQKKDFACNGANAG